MAKYVDIVNTYLTDAFIERATVSFVKETIDEQFNYAKWLEFVMDKFIKSKILKIIKDLNYPTINFKEFRLAISEHLKVWADDNGYGTDYESNSTESMLKKFDQMLDSEFN